MSRPKTSQPAAPSGSDSVARPRETTPWPFGGDGLPPNPGLCAYVCMTRPCHEKRFAHLLESHGIAHYLPLTTAERRYKKTGIRKRREPLFPGYVFAFIEPARKHCLLQDRQLVRAIRVENDPLLRCQLADVRRVLGSGLAVSVHPLIVRGARVRVASGPLCGLEGVVDDPANPQGIVIAVEMLGQGVRVNLSAADLRPLP